MWNHGQDGMIFRRSRGWALWCDGSGEVLTGQRRRRKNPPLKARAAHNQTFRDASICNRRLRILSITLAKQFRQNPTAIVENTAHIRRDEQCVDDRTAPNRILHMIDDFGARIALGELMFVLP
jgi:hypothetical protein